MAGVVPLKPPRPKYKYVMLDIPLRTNGVVAERMRRRARLLPDIAPHLTEHQFAVHVMPPGHYDRNYGRWRVTHVHSGTSAGPSRKTCATAIEAARQLLSGRTDEEIWRRSVLPVVRRLKG